MLYKHIYISLHAPSQVHLPEFFKEGWISVATVDTNINDIARVPSADDKRSQERLLPETLLSFSARQVHRGSMGRVY